MRRLDGGRIASLVGSSYAEWRLRKGNDYWEFSPDG